MPDLCTDLVILLDRSGSMEDRRADHEGGLRSFVRDQRALAGEVRLTFARFDNHTPLEFVYDRIPLDQVEEDKLTLIPRGGTPLIEAMMRLLAHLETALAPEPAHPVVVMVITDGEENASGPDYSLAALKARIAERQRAGWVVLYLGANVDEFAESAKLGIGRQNALGFAPTRAGVANMYRTIGQQTNSFRQAVTHAAEYTVAAGTAAYTMTEADRLAARAVDVSVPPPVTPQEEA